LVDLLGSKKAVDGEVVHFNQKKNLNLKMNLQKTKVCYLLPKIVYIFNSSNYIHFIILVTREIFEKKRKQHYNEFQTAKILAKQMMDEDEDEDENDDNIKQNEASLV